MRDNSHPAADEYLETIWLLADEGSRLIQARLAERLGNSNTAVSEMLDRLAASGYAAREGREIVLTEAGAKRATSRVRRRRLAECMLADTIGLPWRDVYTEAKRFAPVISRDIEERLIVMLGDPAICPHGNLIPGSATPVPGLSLQVALSEVAPGERATLARLAQEIELDYASVGYLEDGGYLLGTTAVVRERGPDGTVMLDLASRPLAVGTYLAARLFVLAAS